MTFSLQPIFNLLFSEKIKLCKFTGVDRAFDIMVETMKLIKLHQMQLKKANPDKEIELDSNTILRKAVMVSQNFNLKKIKLIYMV